jgi:hypothetical protein
VSVKHGQRTIELTFDREQRCFRGLVAGRAEPLLIAAQGLTKTALMGDMAHLAALPAYQLALPFTLDTWRSVEYAKLLAGTT